ncbi:MBL fold metallo-hydrolase [Dictyobacter arantiisoli]|uniref:MBL fold hydrolase n=1 Tax=Dictyobacter arantiisoli TaxID=2014874 RepID=A0A5A5T9W1_9CHLR|nr:MBL fold metallo-hydrolase [Dictyobacter arantiisoli]GCF08291.1 MBL fold hydrolase [Dictyobacter arantiisoli]
MIENSIGNIVRICLPIPFPLKTVNVYALVGTHGWVLIDTGMGTVEGRAALHEGLSQRGLTLDNLQSIVLTHYHPDHVGLSGELQELHHIPVYMHPLDIDNLQKTWGNPQISRARFQQHSQFLVQHGLPKQSIEESPLTPEQQRMILRVPPPEAFHPVNDGERLELAGEHYLVLWLPGHADGQIGLLRERDDVFLAADHVLPRITPNISLDSPENRPDPLQDYLQSLAKVSPLPASIVLPGHGEPFSNLATRTAEIVEHHQRRLTKIIDLLTQQPQDANSITIQLFGERIKNSQAHRMALSEIIAHLEYLRGQGRVTQTINQAGILYYIVSAAASKEQAL